LEVTGAHDVHITLDDEHGGCWNVEPGFPRPQGGVSFTLKSEQTWKAVRIVQAKRAYFHDAATTDTKRKAYCVADDVLPVLSATPGWVEGRFEYNGNVTQGWVREADLCPLPLLPL
jgi:hypothetical protein